LKKWKSLLGLLVVAAPVGAADVAPTGPGLITLVVKNNACTVENVAPICLAEAQSEIRWVIQNKCPKEQNVVVYKFFGVSRGVSCGGETDNPCPERSAPLECYAARTVGVERMDEMSCNIGNAMGCWKYDVFLQCDPRRDAGCAAALDPDVRRPPRRASGGPSGSAAAAAKPR
jgi:hypothetical protein